MTTWQSLDFALRRYARDDNVWQSLDCALRRYARDDREPQLSPPRQASCGDNCE